LEAIRSSLDGSFRDFDPRSLAGRFRDQEIKTDFFREEASPWAERARHPLLQVVKAVANRFHLRSSRGIGRFEVFLDRSQRFPQPLTRRGDDMRQVVSLKFRLRLRGRPHVPGRVAMQDGFTHEPRGRRGKIMSQRFE
jgi:hypothetical protein